MKRLIVMILVVLFVVPLYSIGGINYKSPCVYYYFPFHKCFDSRGFLNMERAFFNGCDVWVLMVLEDGDIIFNRRQWGDFQYGHAVKLTRQQAIDDLNKWINSNYELAKNDRKYRHDGYSVPFYYYNDKIAFEACPAFDSYYIEFMKIGDIVDSYLGFGYSTDNIEKDLFVTSDHQIVILCPVNETPCIEDGVPNFEMYLRCDIEYCLPK